MNPVSSLEGIGRLIGETYPAAHFITVTRGTFAKALDFDVLLVPAVKLAIAIPVLIACAAVLLPKQER